MRPWQGVMRIPRYRTKYELKTLGGKEPLAGETQTIVAIPSLTLDDGSKLEGRGVIVREPADVLQVDIAEEDTNRNKLWKAYLRDIS